MIKVFAVFTGKLLQSLQNSSFHKTCYLGPVYMEASQPGKRAGPLSETNVWLVFIWKASPVSGLNVLVPMHMRAKNARKCICKHGAAGEIFVDSRCIACVNSCFISISALWNHYNVES